MRIKPISLKECELIVHYSAVKLTEFDEPIPGFETRYPDRLESCLLTPFMGFGAEHLYKGLIGKSSIMFYLLIKNHPFRNGNKRIAIIALLYLMAKNGKWIDADIMGLYNFTKWIAASDNALKDETVAAIEKYVKIHLVEYESGEKEESRDARNRE